MQELFSELFWVYDNMLHRKTKGAVEADLWQLVEDNLRYWLSHPGIKEWWVRGIRTPHSPEYESMIDRIIETEIEEDA